MESLDYRQRWELKEYRFEQRFSARTTFFHAALLLLVLGYLSTFWVLQVAQGDEYKAAAETNRLRKIPVPPNRGVIYDRNRQILASTRPALNLVLRREGDGDPDAQLRRLAPVLGIPYEDLKARLEAMRARPPFEPLPLKEDVSLAELARIESRREWFPSVEVRQVARRNYADGAALAHVLGYVGEVGEGQLAREGDKQGLERGDIVGVSGVEKAYDQALRGRRGFKYVTVNNLGRQFGDAEPGRNPEDGQVFQSTIDVRLQKTLHEAFGTEAGAGVFLDPWTGEVLALASTPSYDPNQFARGITPAFWKEITKDPRKPLNDRAITSAYAPGSTFKVLMSVVGLETGVITPSTVMYCSGSANFYGRNFLCWKKGGHGQVDLRRALTHSCNVYFYNVGRMAGIDAIARYGAMFNLGSPTGIDLPGEKSGVLPSSEWKARAYAGTPNAKWFAGETISVSIGQGLVTATPLQMATFLAGIATGGKVPHPHVWKVGAKPPAELPVHSGTFEPIRDALQDVVERGTGGRAALGPISVAGKTGTAQVYKHSAGIDADELPKNERDHAWFVGYAPADKPEIAFAVVVEHGGHGGTTAAPIVRSVLEVFFEDRLPKTKEPPPRAPARRAAGGLQVESEGVEASPQPARSEVALAGPAPPQ